LSAGDGDFAAFAGGRKRSLGRNFRCIKERPDTLNADLKGALASSNVSLGFMTRLSGRIQSTPS